MADMRVAVCFQVVPDVMSVPETDLPSEPGRSICGTYDRLIDTYDESALELALRLKDADPATELTAWTVSDRDDARLYQSLYALGFSEVVRIDCRLSVCSSKQKAKLLAVQLRDYDLILTGRQSSLMGSRTTPRMLAQELGCPFADHVNRIEFAEQEGIRFQTTGDGVVGEGILRGRAVLMVGEGGWLRIPTLREKMSVKGKSCRAISVDPVETDEKKPTRMLRPPRRLPCRFLDGDPMDNARLILELLQAEPAVETAENALNTKFCRTVYSGRLLAEYDVPPEPLLHMSPNFLNVITDYTERADENRGGLERATVVFLVGRGVADEKDRQKLNHLALRYGAELAATRAAVLSGWYPIGKQVGVSGVSLHAKVCVVFGVSGAAALTAGISDCSTVITVNRDSSAPIFKCADYGLVCDCRQVIDAMGDMID